MVQQTWTHFKPLFPIQPSSKTERLNYQSFANHYEVVQNVESYIYLQWYHSLHLVLIERLDALTRTTQLLVLKPNQGRWLNSQPLKTQNNQP
jgi:hypothetical protein